VKTVIWNLSASVIQCGVIAVLLVSARVCIHAQSATEYRLSFPDAVHHVMQVEVTFHDVPWRPLLVQMSRSSPGSYAAFEFAKNVFHEHFTDETGKP
jgi:hypothetical protein